MKFVCEFLLDVLKVMEKAVSFPFKLLYWVGLFFVWCVDERAAKIINQRVNK